MPEQHTAHTALGLPVQGSRGCREEWPSAEAAVGPVRCYVRSRLLSRTVDLASQIVAQLGDPVGDTRVGY